MFAMVASIAMAKVALTTTERPHPPREDLEQVVIAAAEAAARESAVARRVRVHQTAAQAHLESAAEYHRKAAEILASQGGGDAARELVELAEAEAQLAQDERNRARVWQLMVDRAPGKAATDPVAREG